MLPPANIRNQPKSMHCLLFKPWKTFIFSLFLFFPLSFLFTILPWIINSPVVMPRAVIYLEEITLPFFLAAKYIRKENNHQTPFHTLYTAPEMRKRWLQPFCVGMPAKQLISDDHQGFSCVSTQAIITWSHLLFLACRGCLWVLVPDYWEKGSVRHTVSGYN